MQAPFYGAGRCRIHRYVAAPPNKGVTKRRRLSRLSNRALVYEPKMAGDARVAGLSRTVVHMELNKLWRSNSIFNLLSESSLLHKLRESKEKNSMTQMYYDREKTGKLQR